MGHGCSEQRNHSGFEATPRTQNVLAQGQSEAYGDSKLQKLDDGWPESEKHVFQAALSMVVVKKIVGE